METSPPVRDVSERHRANRNKCIIVSLISVLCLAAVVLVIAYITHYRATDLTPSGAEALVDKSLLGVQNDSVIICGGKFEVVLKENDTVLLERLGDCMEITATPTNGDAANGTEPTQPVKIVCKLSASNVKVLSVFESRISPNTTECKFNVTIEVAFELDEERMVEGIEFRVLKNANEEIEEGIADVVYQVLGDSVLEQAKAYAVGNVTVESDPVEWPSICRNAPWRCKFSGPPPPVF